MAKGIKDVATTLIESGFDLILPSGQVITKEDLEIKYTYHPDGSIATAKWTVLFPDPDDFHTWLEP